MTEEDAITFAKSRLTTLFASEGISDLALEEIQRKGRSGWLVTISFLRQRRLQGAGATAGALAKLLPPDWQREEKIVEVNADGEIVAIRHR